MAGVIDREEFDRGERVFSHTAPLPSQICISMAADERHGQLRDKIALQEIQICAKHNEVRSSCLTMHTYSFAS